MVVYKVLVWFNSEEESLPAKQYFATFKEVLNHCRKFDDKEIKVFKGAFEPFEELL